MVTKCNFQYRVLRPGITGGGAEKQRKSYTFFKTELNDYEQEMEMELWCSTCNVKVLSHCEISPERFPEQYYS